VHRRAADALIGVKALPEAIARHFTQAGLDDLAIEDALVSERMGHRAFDAELHRARGEILLDRDPTNPTVPDCYHYSARAAGFCAQRLRSPSSTSQLFVRSKPMQYSRPRSKALRRRPRCQRSLRLRDCWRC
jgi:hypothetical protein